MSVDNTKKEHEVNEKLDPLLLHDDNDVIRATVGDFGRWQLKISVLMALIKFPIAWFQMSIVFLAPPTNFWCKKGKEFENISDEKWQELIVPVDGSSMQNGVNRGYCFMKQLSSDITYGTNTTLYVQCTEYSYNRTLFTSTITSEWDLICDRQKLMDLSQVSLMFGVLLGNIIFGILADKHGRRKILLICLLSQSLFGIFASLSPFFWLFVLLRFFVALANGGTMVTSFVMCMEVVGGKWRTIVPILYQIPFGFGYSLLSVIAYFIRSWRYLHLALGVLSLPYVVLFWLIPESPRWLLAVGRKDEASLILDNAANENKINTDEYETAMTTLSNKCHTDKATKVSVKALFATGKLRKRCYLLYLNWAIAGITFYGFIQYMGHVSQNIFLTVVLGGFVSLPGTIICVCLVSNYGRRLTIAYSNLLTAACCLLILAFPKGVYIFDWPRLVLTGIGTIGLSVSIPAMYLFTGELFPTVLRNSGVGFAMMFSRLGSMIAPLVISLQSVSSFMPLLIIGVALIIQTILILPLPETQGKTLPDTVSDLENGRTVKTEELISLNKTALSDNKAISS